MLVKIGLLLLYVIYLIDPIVGSKYSCYWNRQCPYQLYSSATPYETVRGDIRDHPRIKNCNPISLWSIHRHGNRNPYPDVTVKVAAIATLKDQIIASYEAGNSTLCAQDIDELRKWTWNKTIEKTPAELTGVGYEEQYNLGRRVRLAYPELLNGAANELYVRPTNEQRTITSAIAYVHGLSEGINWTMAIDQPQERDDVIRSYHKCDSYKKEVKEGSDFKDAVNEYAKTEEYLAIQPAVQQRLGIAHQLTSEDIYNMYELCRFDRSLNPNLKSPWCAFFTKEELVVLEFRDDVYHYYQCGYGSEINVNLGQTPLRDLYDSFVAVTQGKGRKMTSYFTHHTMMEMVYCALGLYKDYTPPFQAQLRNPLRKWRSSHMGPMATNIIAVLNRCIKPLGTQTYRVQIFNSEKLTELCPINGCTWMAFQNKFQNYSYNLDFCKNSSLITKRIKQALRTGAKNLWIEQVQLDAGFVGKSSLVIVFMITLLSLV